MAGALGLACALSSACGKKGPPLAPFVRIPAAVDKIAAERVGSDVYVHLTVPAQNIDASTPADVARVDVYGFTGTTPPLRGEFLAQADRLAVIPVAPAPGRGSAPPSAAPADAPAIGALQGMDITVRDVLTPEQLVPKPPPPPVAREARPAVIASTAPPSTGPPQPHRFYMAIAFSDRGRSSPQGTVVDLPLVTLPDPPADLRTAYTATAVTLTWEPSGGLVGFLLDRTLPPEAAPFDEVAAAAASAATGSDGPRGPTQYNVYRADSLDPLVLPANAAQPAWMTTRPLPLNPAPLATLTFSEPVEFGRTQCYTVRAVRGTAPALVEGEATSPSCVVAADTFPPAPPANLTAVAAEGSISLIWEASEEPDLAGYLVLRGEAGSATLQPLNDRPIAESRYTDSRVTPGQRYIYAVVAVDDRVPVPNVSAESARIEETAR